MNKKNYILNNANTRYFDYFFFKKLKGSEPEPTPAVEGEGTNFTLVTESNKKIAEVKCKGDTFQNGSPSPANPVNIQTVTGTQTLNITKGSNVQNYTIALGSIELCKLDTYQDYIYKSGDDWYVHKEINTQVFNPNYAWARTSYSNVDYCVNKKMKDSVFYNNYKEMDFPLLYTNAIHKDTEGGFDQASNANCIFMSPSLAEYWVGFPKGTSLDTMKTELNGAILYYPIATPTETKITDSTLISQLDTILSSGYLKKGTNTVTVTSTGTNLPSIIYIKSN